VFKEQDLPITLDPLQKNWPARSARSLSRSPLRFSETTFQNHKMSQFRCSTAIAIRLNGPYFIPLSLRFVAAFARPFGCKTLVISIL
jgi:hypothetical protein